jgi:hypothetical protein
MLIIKHLQRGGGYVTPNICYIEETDGIIMKPKTTNYLTYNIINDLTSEVTTDYPVCSYIYAILNNSEHIKINKGSNVGTYNLGPVKDTYIKAIGVSKTGYGGPSEYYNTYEDECFIYKIKK